MTDVKHQRLIKTGPGRQTDSWQKRLKNEASSAHVIKWLFHICNLHLLTDCKSSQVKCNVFHLFNRSECNSNSFKQFDFHFKSTRPTERRRSGAERLPFAVALLFDEFCSQFDWFVDTMGARSVWPGRRIGSGGRGKSYKLIVHSLTLGKLVWL